MKPKAGLGNERILVISIVVLALWATLPFVTRQLLGVSGPLGGPLTTLEVWLFTLPAAGIVAAIYGWYYGTPLAAFLIGVVPYAPLVILGIPAVLFVGIPIGTIGAGSGLQSQKREIMGGVLLMLGVASWLIFTAVLISGFR